MPGESCERGSLEHGFAEGFTAVAVTVEGFSAKAIPVILALPVFLAVPVPLALPAFTALADILPEGIGLSSTAR